LSNEQIYYIISKGAERKREGERERERERETLNQPSSLP